MNNFENSNTEFKVELTDKLEREIVAFLNSPKGGDIYIGIDDNGQIIGVENPDKLQLIISDRIKNNILPTCLGFFDVIAEEREGKVIIHIIIARGTEKPYYLKKFGMSPAGCFLRVGSGVQQMPTDLIDKFYSTRTRNSLRKIASPRFGKHSFAQLKIYYEEKGFTLNDSFLQNLDLFTEDGKYNFVAYLLSDVNSISVKVAKYAGNNKSNLIENEEYGYCSLIKATERILDKLLIENKTFTQITGDAHRKEKSMINKIALREALINAIVHNDYSGEVPPVIEIYSDRLSITSYGGLVQGLSLEEFFQGRSMPRNRELMRVFKDLELVEQLGSGIYRILDVYSKEIFKVSENFLEICFPYEKEYLKIIENQKREQVTTQVESKKEQVPPQVESKREQVKEQVFLKVSILISAFKGNENIAGLMKTLSLSGRRNFKYNYLNPALESGFIEMTQPNSPNSPTQKYRLTTKGKELQKILIEGIEHQQNKKRKKN